MKARGFLRRLARRLAVIGLAGLALGGLLLILLPEGAAAAMALPQALTGFGVLAGAGAFLLGASHATGGEADGFGGGTGLDPDGGGDAGDTSGDSGGGDGGGGE